ncbi:hypothetical protein SAMN04488564_104837 [Lentzea waywayandensis]|uniref:Lipoprotein n=1 Tax=Lentzea waywayandensis TaxID=84724 RepID=A0A1I6ELF7_9PSEU|nr:hypothetical protein [Lentzea waywayandensis]SFR18525.1 hypothetical protein SAMN04488564_104837 [Lentzea waywayandensis]
MRKVIVACAACLVLAGCSSEWQGEIDFRVAEFYDHRLPDGATEKRVRLEPVGSLPEDAEEKDIKGMSVLETDIAGTVGVDDGVVCVARHESGETKLSQCEKA